MKFYFNLKSKWQQTNQPAFRILALALSLAIFTLTVLLNLNAALKSQMNRDQAALLGAACIIEAPYALPEKLKEMAISKSLKITKVIDFFAMVTAGDKMQLASIVAVQDEFPLIGNLIIKTLTPQREMKAPPPMGEAWVEQSLLDRLQLSLMSQVKIGSRYFTITGIIQSHPVSTAESSLFQPLVYVNMAEVSAMQVLQSGSRAVYQLLLAGSEQKLNEFLTAFHNLPASEWKVITPQSGKQNLNKIFIEIERYLAIILLIELSLAAVVIVMSAQLFSLHQQRVIALWRCLGATHRLLWQQYLLPLVTLLALVLVGSIISGYLAVYIGFFAYKFIWQWHWQPGFVALLAGITLIFGLTLPSLLTLFNIAPKAILQEVRLIKHRYHFGSYCITGCIIYFIANNIIGDKQLGFSFELQLIGLTLLLMIVASLIWRAFSFLSSHLPLAWRLGLTYLTRYSWQTRLQWIVISMAVMLLLLINIIKHDFMKSWQQQLPLATPNYFLINVQTEQVPSLYNYLHTKGIQADFYPIVRGRMSHINHQPIEGLTTTSEIPTINRPLNLTWLEVLPSDNKIVSGPEWNEKFFNQPVISIEQDFQERQHLKIGDSLTFQIADKNITGTIVQVREVEWSTFKPNFFVIFPPGVLDNFPHSYITSFYLSPLQRGILVEILKNFPELSIIDIQSIINQAQVLIAKLAIMVDLLCVVVILFGILIIYSNVLATINSRLQGMALLRVLGASKKILIKVLMIEWLTLGLSGGIVASGSAQLLAKKIATSYFSMTYSFNIMSLIEGILFNSLLMLICGVVACRAVFKVKPLLLVRTAGG